MKQWWKEAIFYEIYMPSYMDGNGDGIGDFKGIISKLDYLKELGITGIWLTPFYPSPKIDNGYDISGYYSIDPDYGSMEDFELFIKEAHARGIKVIADLVLNHTSSEHEWFKESRSSKSSPKRDWYIWQDPVQGKPPSNWESFFGGPAWEWDEQTEQYYYHAFAKEQVDLNWSNPEVKQAMYDVMKFWINKGIDGFRLDVINFLTVQNHFTDNPFNEETGEQIHQYDKDQKGVLSVIAEIASFVKQNGDLFLVGEVGSEDLELLKNYCGDGLLDVVFNFNLGSIQNFDLDRIFTELQEMERQYRNDQIPTLFFGSHDMPRYLSRFWGNEGGTDKAKLIAMLMLSAKGVPFIYYGEEIGMTNFEALSIEQMRDIQGITAYQLAVNNGNDEKTALKLANEKNRDKSRSPMQWDGSKYGGFSTVAWRNCKTAQSASSPDRRERRAEEGRSVLRKLAHWTI
ncbi:alpha-glucosidase [Bacillus sp. V3-13]|uniref:alpha-glucosidase n=1 Tax=Bacillus sp. V3-13 TaxID=2053728 RepID=UPI00215226B4|nr:alpha-glucosidase [Bacillus sp. V3-13]